MEILLVLIFWVISYLVLKHCIKSAVKEALEEHEKDKQTLN